MRSFDTVTSTDFPLTLLSTSILSQPACWPTWSLLLSEEDLPQRKVLYEIIDL